MKFKVGDRVACVNPNDDRSGHHMEWLNCAGTIVSIISGRSPYWIDFDTVPEYYRTGIYSVHSPWYCSEDELEFESIVVAPAPAVNDLL